MLDNVRKSHPCALATPIHEYGIDKPIPGEGDPPNEQHQFRKVASGRNAFERSTLARLQREDPDLGDVIVALELKKKLPEADKETFYREFRKSLGDNTSKPSKRSELAIAKMSDYELTDDLLRRRVYHSPSTSWTTRIAVPEKGTRSFS